MRIIRLYAVFKTSRGMGLSLRVLAASSRLETLWQVKDEAATSHRR